MLSLHWWRKAFPLSKILEDLHNGKPSGIFRSLGFVQHLTKVFVALTQRRSTCFLESSELLSLRPQPRIGEYPGAFSQISAFELVLECWQRCRLFLKRKFLMMGLMLAAPNGSGRSNSRVVQRPSGRNFP